jgi:hypothetical protein
VLQFSVYGLCSGLISTIWMIYGREYGFLSNISLASLESASNAG